MTTCIELDIPVYRADRYEQLEKTGRIKVSSTVGTIEDGTLTKEYDRLKKEIENLIADVNGRTRLADEVFEFENQIRWKSQNLKDILRDIEKATAHYDSLKIVLENLGIDPKATRLTFDTKLLLSAAGSKVEVTPTEIYPGSEF